MTELPLQAWHEFYFLLGTSAAALTGLMGVVVSINPETIAERPQSGVRAFVTPTIVFFTTAFVVSALLVTPHLSLRSLAVLLAVTGIAGVAYLAWTRSHHYWVHAADRLSGRHLAARRVWRPDARIHHHADAGQRHPQRLGPGDLAGAAEAPRLNYSSPRA